MNRPSRLAVIAILALLLGALALAGCSADQPVEPAEPAEQPAEEQPAGIEEESGLYTPAYKPNGQETAVFKTSQGDITVELFGTDAPIHVGNFVELVQKGFYDDTKFHRYEPGFVIQGGDPQTKEATSEQVAAAVGDPASTFGTGGPGHFIRGEFDPAKNPNKHVKGALGMARSQSSDSAGSQFYFTLAETPFLDGSYTVFGRVTAGMDVVEKLRAGDVVTGIVLSGVTE